MRRIHLVVAAAMAAWGLGAQFAGSASPGSGVVIPELTEAGSRGQAAFAKFCARCHGVDAAGTGSGPPLIHKIYHPGHHGAMAFVMAARQGSPAHHWQFGDMPPVAGISDAGIAEVIEFVRAVQKTNGIF